MPRKSFRARLRALFILLALGSSLSVRTARGQDISFLREFSDSDYSDTVGVAVDATAIYVAGGQADGFLRKHDLDGRQLWIRRFAPESSAATAIAVNAGSVYVLGVVGSNLDGTFAKYDAAGEQLWIRQVRGRGNSVAADATGVYVVSTVAAAQEGFLRKYSGDGAELWTHNLSSDWPEAVAADATGIYVAGRDFLHKYSDAGEKLWTRRFPDIIHTSVAVEATGVYVAGEAHLRVVLRKYDSIGNELWIREFNGVEPPVKPTRGGRSGGGPERRLHSWDNRPCCCRPLQVRLGRRFCAQV